MRSPRCDRVRPQRPPATLGRGRTGGIDRGPLNEQPKREAVMRVTRLFLVMAVWLPLLLAVGSRAASAHTAEKTPSRVRWTQQTTYPAPIGDLGSLACATATTCVAIGSITRQPQEIRAAVITKTTDGGQSWTSEPVPVAGALSGLACPSSAFCVAVGGYIGGGGPSFNPDRLGTVMASTDGGRSWTVQSVPRGVGYLNGVSCASVSFCVAVGESPDDHGGTTLVTTDQGSHWSRSHLPAEVSGLSLVSCPVPGTCLAVGHGAIRTTDGGLSWAAVNPNVEVPLVESLSCITALRCIAAGSGPVVGDANPTSGIETTDDGGVTWSTSSLPSAGSANASGLLVALSCGSPTMCVAVGGGIGPRGGQGVAVIFVTTDAGATWRSRQPPKGMGEIEGVSCVGPADCVVNGSDPGEATTLSAVTANGGSSWTTNTIAGGIGGIQSVSCPSARSCVAVGTNASSTYALRTADGGHSWTALSMPANVVGLSSVSCGSTQVCVAVGFQTVPGQQDTGALEGAVLDSADGGATWSLPALPGVLGNLSAVACSSPTHCVALGDVAGANQAIALTTVDGGSTWAQPVDIVAVSAVQGLSCPTVTVCVAVGQQVPVSAGPSSPVAARTRDGGRTWAEDSLPGRGVEPNGVSCASASLCVAVGAVTHNVDSETTVVPGVIMVSTDAGAHWKMSTKRGVGNLAAVHCPSTTHCAAVGRNRTGTAPAILVGRPGLQSLLVAQTPKITGTLLGISCHGAHSCELVGLNSFGGGLLAKVKT